MLSDCLLWNVAVLVCASASHNCATLIEFYVAPWPVGQLQMLVTEASYIPAVTCNRVCFIQYSRALHLFTTLSSAVRASIPYQWVRTKITEITEHNELEQA